MTVSEGRERLKKLHPVLKGLIFTALASFVVVIEQWLVKHSFDFQKEALRAYWLYSLETYKGIFALVFMAPLREEFLYRGPILVTLLIIRAIFRNAHDDHDRMLQYGLYGGCIVFGLVLNYFWAFSHIHHPYTIFVFGVIWGACMLLTRKLHYAIILHAGSNAIAVLGITLIHYFSK